MIIILSPDNNIISNFYFSTCNVAAPGAKATAAHQASTCTFYFWHSCIWREAMWLGSVQLYMSRKWCLPPTGMTCKITPHVPSPLCAPDDMLQDGNSLGPWVTTWRRVIQPTWARHTPLCGKSWKFGVHLLASPNKCHHLVRLQRLPSLYYEEDWNKMNKGPAPLSGPLLLFSLHVKITRTNIECIPWANQI